MRYSWTKTRAVAMGNLSGVRTSIYFPMGNITRTHAGTARADLRVVKRGTGAYTKYFLARMQARRRELSPLE